MRKTRSQTQAEAAMANAGRMASTSHSPSIVSSTENCGSQNMSASIRGPQNIQIATVSAQKRIVPQTEHFKIKVCLQTMEICFIAFVIGGQADPMLNTFFVNENYSLIQKQHKALIAVKNPAISRPAVIINP